jgi:CRP-like cAMP-binding protein
VLIKRDTSYGSFEIARLGEGELFGETSFVDQSPRSVDAVAMQASELFVLDPAKLNALGEQDPRFAMALWWTFWRSLSQKLRSTNERLTKFFSEAGKPLPSIHAPLREPTGSFRLQLAQKQDLFSEQKLSRMEIHFLASLSKERRLLPGEVLFREGDVGDAMYVVVDGRVRIGKHIPAPARSARLHGARRLVRRDGADRQPTALGGGDGARRGRRSCSPSRATSSPGCSTSARSPRCDCCASSASWWPNDCARSTTSSSAGSSSLAGRSRALGARRYGASVNALRTSDDVGSDDLAASDPRRFASLRYRCRRP